MSSIDSNLFLYFDLKPITLPVSQKSNFVLKSHIPPPPKHDANTVVLTNAEMGIMDDALDKALNPRNCKVLSLSGMTGITKTTLVNRLLNELETKYLKINALIPSITSRNLYNIDPMRVISYATQFNYIVKGQSYIQDRFEYDNIIFYFAHMLMHHDIVDPKTCTKEDLAYVKLLFKQFMEDTGLHTAFKMTSGKDIYAQLVILLSRDTDIIAVSMYNRVNTSSSTDKINAINSQYLWAQFYTYLMFALYFGWPIIDISSKHATWDTMSQLQDDIVGNLTNTMKRPKFNHDNRLTELVTVTKTYTENELEALLANEFSDRIETTKYDDDDDDDEKMVTDTNNNFDTKAVISIEEAPIVEANTQATDADEKFFNYMDVYIANKYEIAPIQMHFNHLLLSNK